MSNAPCQPLFTIGHSNHSIEHFLALLRRHGVEVVADVRSRPYSRFVPHFSKERLERILGEGGIDYLFLGRELGGKPPQSGSGRWPPDYRARIRDPGFAQGIERLLEAATARRVALLCRERDPLDCHRLHLVCRYARAMVGPIRHILPDGTIEEQPATERRLIARIEKHQLNPSTTLDRAALERAYDSWGAASGP